MKLIYSHLQKFLPDLKVDPQQLRDDLTMIGHFTNYFEEIDNEIVFDLDIKVNRGDCLGYYGIARDLAVFYSLELKNLYLRSTIYDLRSNNSFPTCIIAKTTLGKGISFMENNFKYHDVKNLDQKLYLAAKQQLQKM